MKRMQKKLVPILLIATIASVAVFGFVSMDMAMGHEGMRPCFFVFRGSEPCSSLQSVAAITAHFLDMIERLSAAFASFDIFALIFSFVVFLAILLLSDSHPRRVASQKFRRSFLSEPYIVWKDALLRWLAYHNKRDYLAPIRVRIES